MLEGISISWITDHRRSHEIASIVGVKPYFVRSASKFLFFRYLAQHRRTKEILKATSPSVIVVMQPPPLALLSVIGYAKRNKTILLGDLHSGVFFDRKWSWTSNWVLKVLRRHGAAIVPNSDLASICTAANVQVFVSHGRLSNPTRPAETGISESLPEKFLLVPFTYASDEPVNELFDAASLTPEITWVLTGNAPKRFKDLAPSNIIFTGFVSNDEYLEVRLKASAIFALTKRESTMQSAGYEALASTTPLVTVPTRVLKSYFEEGALYTELEPSELAKAAKQVLSEESTWKERISARRSEIEALQHLPAEQIRKWLVGRVRDDG